MKSKDFLNMNRSIMMILSIVILSQNVFSQSYIPSKEDLESFFKTKTMVVLEDNPMLQYNLNIREVMKQHWNITEYDFISFKEFEEMRQDPQYSFLLMSTNV